MPAEIGKSQIDRPTAIGILLWLALQLAALGISAARIPFWARAPQAVEQDALVVMLAIQIGVSALIFPHILGTAGSTMLSIGSAWVMGLLASHLSDAFTTALVRSETYVTVWLLSLHLWNRALPSPGAKLIGAAIAGIITIGGPVLWYLGADFERSTGQFAADSIPNFGPLCGVLSQTFPQPNHGSWLELIIIFTCGALAFTSNRLASSSRQVIH
jgi:hypothetical protein